MSPTADGNPTRGAAGPWRRPVLALALVACLVAAVAACSDDADRADPVATTTDPPGPSVPPTVSVEPVSLPTELDDVQLPWWTADGSRLVFSARSSAFPGMQILSVTPDGRDLRCLTCAISTGDPPLMKPIVFDDGERVVVRVGNQTPFVNGTHAVLECSPSVVQCDAAELVPIEVPDDPLVVQPQREFRVAPGGERVGFTQMRDNRLGDPTFVSVVAGLERRSDRYVLVDPRVISDRGELKQFSPDGATAYVSAFVEGPEAGNGDVLAVDLTDGAVGRFTTYPDYDEPVEPSPTTDWFTVGSARTASIFEALAMVRRPNAIGGAISPLSLYLFNTYRDELLEPWLTTAEGEAAGETGVALNPGSLDAGWEGRMIPNWSPDGTRVVFWEADVASTAGSADAGSRIVVATLDGLGPTRPAPEPTEPDLGWAPPLAGFSPAGPYIPEPRDGRVAGRIEVTATEGEALTIEVRYVGFSDEDGWVLDGTERVVNVGGPTGSMEYDADVSLSGDHSGFLRATEVRGDAAGGFTGLVESQVDGSVATLDLG